MINLFSEFSRGSATFSERERLAYSGLSLRDNSYGKILKKKFLRKSLTKLADFWQKRIDRGLDRGEGVSPDSFFPSFRSPVAE